MRIAIVGTDLCAVDDRGGGLEQVLRRWALFLCARHDVTVVSHRVRAGAAPEPYRVVAVTNRAGLRGALAALAPDVVSLHNRPHWESLCPPAASVAVTFHNYPVAWRVPARSWSRLRSVAPARVRWSTVSKALAGAAVEALGGAAVVAITPPSIHPAFFAAPPWQPTPSVLAPSRLMAKKGVGDLLDAAEDPALADVTFSFADVISPWARPTAEHRALRAAIRAVPNAELFPPVAGPTELAARYARAGVVACPVREPEGLGLVALEAQACGAPLVTTDLGGLREATFPPNRCIPARSEGALRDALIATLRRRSGGAEARARVRAAHTPEASGAVFEEFVTRG